MSNVYSFQVLGSQATAQGRDDPQLVKTGEVNQSVLPLPTVGLLGPGPGFSFTAIPMSATFGANPARGFIGTGTSAAASLHVLGFGGDSPVWHIDGAALTNNGALPIRPRSVISAGRATCELEITFDGNAATWGASTPSTVRGQILLAYPTGLDYTGLMHFLEFADEPPDGAGTAAQSVARLLDLVERGGAEFSVGVQSNGQERIARDCAFAALDPCGRLYVRPGDVGNLPEQLPQSVLQNTAAHFRFFPGVFFRRGSYGRHLERVGRDAITINAANQGSQPLQIREVQFQPTASDWLLVIDGSPIVVRVAHPTGSDFRRALECWNGALVPLLQRAGGNATAAEVIGGTAAGTTIGLMDRLRYLQYARFLAPVASEETFVDFPQTDTGLL